MQNIYRRAESTNDVYYNSFEQGQSILKNDPMAEKDKVSVSSTKERQAPR